MRTLREDPLVDVGAVLGNWEAVAVFGRERVNPTAPSGRSANGIPLSRRSFALLLAEPSWLMVLKNNDI